MRIALSSAAAPHDSLSELIEGCLRRGLDALHLVAGHAHGLTPDCDTVFLDGVCEITRESGVTVVSYEVADVSRLTGAQCVAKRLGAQLATETVVLDAAAGNVADAARDAFRKQPDLQHLTLCGGGPEAAQFEGRGIGVLMAQLALMNYGGVLALAPSSSAVLPVWRTWLRRGRNWGCGSKTSDASLVQMGL